MDNLDGTDGDPDNSLILVLSIGGLLIVYECFNSYLEHYPKENTINYIGENRRILKFNVTRSEDGKFTMTHV